jgi:hypothetical protein
MLDTGIQNFAKERSRANYIHLLDQINKSRQDGSTIVWVSALAHSNPQDVSELNCEQVWHYNAYLAGCHVLKKSNSLVGVVLLEKQFQYYVRVNNESALKACHVASWLEQVPRCLFLSHLADARIPEWLQSTPRDREDLRFSSTGSRFAPTIRAPVN